MSRGDTLPGGTRAVTGSSPAVAPMTDRRARPTQPRGGAVRGGLLGTRRPMTPLALVGWAILAAIVVAGQLLHAPSPLGDLADASSAPAVPDATTAAAAHAPAAHAPAPLTDAIAVAAAVRPGPVGLLAFGPTLAPAVASPAAAPPATAATVAAATPAPVAPAPGARTAEERERPLLRYLGGEHRFESPLLMPRLREGLRVKLPQLPHVAGLSAPRRLLARPRPGEPLPVLITAYCLKGTTRRGRPVRTGIVAADPHVFPLARHVELYAGGRFLGRFLVDDTGGKIRGQRIDIWTPDCDDAVRFGARRGVATLVALSEVRRTRDSTGRMVRDE